MKRFRFTLDGSYDDSYDLALYQDDIITKHHILIIMQTVDSRDLEARELLSRDVYPTYRNVIKYARQHALRIDEFEPVSFTVVNFNDTKHLHLSPDLRTEIEQRFADRVHMLIQKLRPTKVLISGDGAFRAIHPQVATPELKRGWVHQLKYGKKTLPTVGTLDFARLLERDGLNGNLLGFFTHHLANLIVGYSPYSIADIKPNPVYVNTDEKFKELLTLLSKTKRVSIDTETKNLSVNFNSIYMIQFCVEEKQECSYIVPLNHPKTPLTDKQRRQWTRQLRRFFVGDRTFFKRPYAGPKLHKAHRLNTIASAEELPELMFFNGSYDLRVLRSCLGIDYIPNYVYEIRAGEHLLDENASDLKVFGTRSGGLAYVACYYGNDFYQTASFGKEQRETCGQVNPDDPGLLNYCAMDTQLLHGIRRGQIIRASHQRIAGTKNYKPYFLRHQRHIMGETEQQLSRLRQNGSTVDINYLRSLVSPGSPILKEMATVMDEFKLYPSVIDTNKTLISSTGYSGVGLWGEQSQTWLFTLSKPAHRAELFLNHIGLEPVSFTAKGAPAIDKEFIEAYKTVVPEVETYATYQELEKLYSTYVKGWLKRLRTTMDGSHDHALRPDYSYMSVATGRLASYDPSLQVIPQRGASAKLIKRAFIATPGRLNVRFDFSAHEVRFWAIIANDKKLAEAFRIGQKLRQDYILNPTPENKEALKKHGDLHLQNVKRFFNRVVDKSHPLRDAVKAVVFGAIYGKSAKTLGEDTKLPEIREARGKIKALLNNRLEAFKLPKDQRADAIIAIDREVQELNSQIAKIRAEDRTDFAQDILDRLMREFANGGKWLERMKQIAKDHQHVYAPHGRMRHLYATLIDDDKTVSRQLRRGVNAPIQGLGSEQGTETNRAIDRSYYMEVPVVCDMLNIDESSLNPLSITRLVHDASYFATDYETVLALVHIMQHEATYGSAERFDKHFGFKFAIEPEIEIGFSAVDDKEHTWDWTLNNLVDCISNVLDDAASVGVLKGSKKEAMTKIFKPWINADCRAYLHEHYPLLGVPEAIRNVPGALKYAKTKIAETDR